MQKDISDYFNTSYERIERSNKTLLLVFYSIEQNVEKSKDTNPAESFAVTYCCCSG